MSSHGNMLLMEESEQPATQQQRPLLVMGNRRRAFKACDSCRKSKEKCEGGVPCRRCARGRRKCLFSQIDLNERSSTRPSYDGLSKDGTESERLQLMEKIMAGCMPDLSLDIESLRKAERALRVQPRTSTEAIESCTNDLETFVVDDEECTIDTLPTNTSTFDNSAQYSGEFSYLNLSMKIRNRIEEWMKTAVPEASSELGPLEERWKITQLQLDSSAVADSTTCLPPRYVADFLVHIFLKYVQTNNFYIDEGWLYESLNACYNKQSSLSSDDASAVCSVLMVLALGTQFAHLESCKTAVSADEDTESNTPFSEDEVGLTLFQSASKLLPTIIATASMRSVQACLLVATYLMPLDTGGICYTYFGIALKLAVQNGMHRRYRGKGLPARMVELRNRVFWTAYTIERRISILHGLPVSLSENDIDVPLPTNLPGLTPYTETSKYDSIIAFIKLTLKLGNLSDDIMLLRKRPREQQKQIFDRLLLARKDLTDCWSNLPKGITALTPGDVLLRPNVHLKLDYCLTRIFLGRPFIFSKTKEDTKEVQNSSSSSRARSTLRTECLDAAFEILDLCQLLRNETGLARASYLEFSSCRAALLVILAQSLDRRTERFTMAIIQGMAFMKIMSRGVGWARSAATVIEGFERAIRRLDSLKDEALIEKNDGPISAYERFKSWEMIWKAGLSSPSNTTCSAANIQVSGDFNQGQYPANLQLGVDPDITDPESHNDFNFGDDATRMDRADQEMLHTEVFDDYFSDVAFPQMPAFDYDFFTLAIPSPDEAPT